MRLRRGWLALIFGLAAVWIALTGLLYVLQSIATTTALLIEIGTNYG